MMLKTSAPVGALCGALAALSLVFLGSIPESQANGTGSSPQ